VVKVLTFLLQDKALAHDCVLGACCFAGVLAAWLFRAWRMACNSAASTPQVEGRWIHTAFLDGLPLPSLSGEVLAWVFASLAVAPFHHPQTLPAIFLPPNGNATQRNPHLTAPPNTTLCKKKKKKKKIKNGDIQEKGVRSRKR